MLPPLLFFALLAVLWGVIHFLAPLLWRLLTHFAKIAASWSTRSKWVASKTGEHSVLRDYFPVILILLVGFLLTIAAGDELVDLIELLTAQSPELTEIDQQMHDWAVTQRQSGATHFFVLMSVIGGPLALGILTAVVALFLIFHQRYRWAAYLIITALGGSVLNLQMKEYFARARPSLAEALRDAHGFSFPSGHAMGATVVFGALSYVAFRALHTWRWKSGAIATAVALVIAIASSRIYLGVHWISDIAAGALAGTLWVTTTTVAYEVTRRIRMVLALRRQRATASAQAVSPTSS